MTHPNISSSDDDNNPTDQLATCMEDKGHTQAPSRQLEHSLLLTIGLIFTIIIIYRLISVIVWRPRICSFHLYRI